ncbi:MAG: lytic murein transglycosylase [Magnetococcales bacterium]|nr:lytic murein transglycosylase [Magnetococcales bacterium]
MRRDKTEKIADCSGLESGAGCAAGLLVPRRELFTLAGALFVAGLVPFGRACFAEGVLDRQPWLQPLVSQHGFSAGYLENLLRGREPRGKVMELMDRQAEDMPYHRYRTLFVTAAMEKQGRERMKTFRTLFEEVERRFQVPAGLVLAIWGVESRFGTHHGEHPVLDTIFTLATRYSRRATFFQEQFIDLLLLSREEKLDPLALKGSYAGAMGQVQMLPGTMRRHAVDFDGDGRKDVFDSVPDVLGSIANYFRNMGWQTGKPVALPVTLTAGPLTPTYTVDKLETWGDWREKGVSLADKKLSLPDGEPVGLVRLAAEKGERYYAVLENFAIITRWNRSRNYAMVISELIDLFGKRKSP